MKTGEKSVLIESTGSTPVAYKGKVIYTRVEKALFLGRGLHYINGKETLIYDKFGGKLYVCNIDGSEDKLLCDIAGNNCILDSGAYTIGGVYGAGDYALWKLWYYEPAKENPKVLQRGKDRILAVNINTGEYKILSAE